jgi:hypothetical protein
LVRQLCGHCPADPADLSGNGVRVRVGFERLDYLSAFGFWNHVLTKAQREFSRKNKVLMQKWRAAAWPVPEFQRQVQAERLQAPRRKVER